MKDRVRPLLDNIGFSGLEIDVYLALLEEPHASGYRLAQKIGKLVGSTYKAIDSLRAKNAIFADETTRPTTYIAVPIGEYTDARRRDLETLRTQIEHELRDVAASPAQEGIFELTSAGQVYERCRSLLRSARKIALLNADARPLQELRTELSAAADRGVKVLVKTRALADTSGRGIMTIESQSSAFLCQPSDARGRDELGVAVDHREYVQAFLRSDGSGVEEAIWVRHPHLASQVCQLLQSDFTLTRVRALVQAGKEVKEIGREMHRLTRMVELQAPSGMLPQEWVLTDAKKVVQKRRRALKAEAEPQPVSAAPRVTKVTLRQIELIMVASSRTVVAEVEGFPDLYQAPPEGARLPAIDPNTLIDPLL